MLSKFLRYLLALSALSPILLVYWFKEFSVTADWHNGLVYLIIGLFLFFLPYIIINFAIKKLGSIPVGGIEHLSNVDSNCKNTMFLILYLLPILPINILMITFLIILFAVVFDFDILHFNPVIMVFGYHRYLVKFENTPYFVLLSKKIIVNKKQLTKVVTISDYIVVDISDNN